MKNADTYAKMESLYRKTAGISSGALNLTSKEFLRDRLLEFANTEKVPELSTEFLKQSTYDSWGATGKEKERLETSMKQYILSGASSEMVTKLNAAMKAEAPYLIPADAVLDTLHKILPAPPSTSDIERAKTEIQEIREKAMANPDIQNAAKEAKETAQGVAENLKNTMDNLPSIPSGISIPNITQ